MKSQLTPIDLNIRMKKTREIRKRKVVIYYFLTIVIPCVILGILAFRGIRNDHALIERAQRNEIQEITHSITTSLNNKLDTIENIVSQEVRNDIVGKIFSDQNLDTVLSRLPVIASIFIIDSEDNNIGLMDKDLIYYPNQVSVTNDNILPKLTSILEKGWVLEFQEKDYAKAIRYYKGHWNANKDRKTQGTILNIIARIQKKQNDAEAALASYGTLSQNYNDVYLQGKIPLGLTAQRQMAIIFQERGDTLSFLSTTEQLLNDLNVSKWKINKAHFQLAINDVKERIHKVSLPDDSGFQQLFNRNLDLLDGLEKKEKNTEYLIGIIPEIESMIPGFTPQDKSKWKGMVKRNGDDYFISLNPAGDRGISIGIIYSMENLQQLLKSEIIKNEDMSDTEWKILNENGGILAYSGEFLEDKNPVISTLPSTLPLWTMEFYPVKKGLFRSLIQSSGGIYFYIFIIILFILFLGLILILHTVNDEIKLSRMKSQFITTVSHEFKSPLTSIRQMAEMLEQKRVPNAERRQFYYSAILQQSERLTHLIENILDFSRMEENQKVFQFEKSDITALVKDVVEYYQNIMIEKGYTIKFYSKNTVPSFEFDKEAIEQVVHNLIDNACKFSENDKRVDVTIENNYNAVTIIVEDHGIGIMKEDQEKIFNRFYRAGNELTQKVKGSGIGLTIVRQIIEAHRGKITVESIPGHGSTFRVTLPINNKMKNEKNINS